MAFSERNGLHPTTFRSDAKYAEVSSNSEINSDVVVPNGETWEINLFRGSGAYTDDSVASIVWDPVGVNTILACTHGDTRAQTCVQVVGDGVKVLRISLVNDTNRAHVIGASWEAQKL